MDRSRRRPVRSALALAVSVGLAHAAVAEDRDPSALAPITVVGATPLPGTQINVAKVPYEVRTLSASDLELTGQPNLTGALDRRLGGVSLNDNLDDPFQPDIVYRGFTASPVLGTPEGLAVYQNGVRINETFGDAVNWDLLPDNAVGRIDVVGTNPVYGLNALGGAVVVAMKTGFDEPGGALTASGGSFGQRDIELSYGAHSDHWGVFVSGRGLGQDGWRQFSADRVRQLYADLGWRGDRLNLDLSYAGAANDLHGESPSPVQELAVDRRLVFTSPQLNANRLSFVVLNGRLVANPSVSLAGNLFVRAFSQDVANGDTTDATPCQDPALAGLLCQPGGATPLVSTRGGPVPDVSNGGQ